MSDGRKNDDQRLPWLNGVNDEDEGAEDGKNDSRRRSPNEHPTDRAATAVVLVLAAVWAYFSVPVLRFTNPDWLQVFGFMLGFGVVGWLLSGRIGQGPRWQVMMVLLAAIALFGLNRFMANASASSENNSARCAAIQRDMLSSHPRRSDGPNLFQALSCKPQGDQNVSFPKQRSSADQPQAKKLAISNSWSANRNL